MFLGRILALIQYSLVFMLKYVLIEINVSPSNRFRVFASAMYRL